MSKELVISANRHETRVAVIEDDQVVEVYHQRENEYSLAGSIHKGRVTRVLPGMQSAFVDIGLDRDAFLYVSDFFEDNEEYDKIVTSVEEKVLKLDRPAQSGPVVTLPPIAIPAADAPAELDGPGPELSALSDEVQAPPAAVALTAAGQERRDDRDRRGRRPRRRRGQKPGGRSLPDSKYYSPGSRGSSENEPAPQSAAPEPIAEIALTPVEEAPVAKTADDFFVLPGESLAKYTRPGDEEEEQDERAAEAPAEVDADEPEEESEAYVAEPESLHNAAVFDAPVEEPAAVVPSPVAEAAPAVAEAAVEEPEAAVVIESQPESHAEFLELPERDSDHVAAPAEEPRHDLASPDTHTSSPVEDEATPTVAEEAETAEDIEAAPTDAGEPEAADAEEASEESVELSAASDSGEESEIVEAGEAGEEGEALVEPEGPEPARIPTSLTATLREQNPRYLHRVSRRMRRRGRDGRGGDSNRGQQAGPGGPPDTRAQDSVVKDRPERSERPERQERSERPERSERSERPERSERSAPPPQSSNVPAAAASRPDKGGVPSISDLLHEGQEIIVQIAKEPLGQKGARITSHIALPGRFLVYMPTVDHIGVSRKIPSDEERLRLKRVLQSNRTGISGGYIVRTAGEGRTEEELRADMMFLYNMWLDMRQKAERKPAPLLIHHDLNVVERILRDQLTASFKSIWVDNEEIYESVLRFVQRFQPLLVNRVKMYTRSTPIFEEFGITGELEKALRPKVWLKSGGYIVINQTEALVAIDINTGKFVGKSNRLEDTIVKTNTDAIKEIVRQIRLRDLGGIIVVDFIDMDERKNRQKVMQALEEAMRADRAPYKILQFNDFGLVAITRKRVKQSLERTLCTPCPYCEGAGYVKSAQTVVGEILQEAHKISSAVEGKDVMLRVSPDVAKLLKSNQNTFLQELEEILGKTVMIKSDAQLHLEKFDLA